MLGQPLQYIDSPTPSTRPPHLGGGRQRDLGFGIWDLGFGIWDLGFGIWDLGFDLGFGIWDLGFGISDLGFARDLELGCQVRSHIPNPQSQIPNRNGPTKTNAGRGSARTRNAL